MTVVPITKFPVVGAFSEKEEVVAEKVAIDFELGEKKFTGNFYILKKLPHRVIIGQDFLSAHNAKIDYNERGMEIELEEDEKIIAIEESRRRKRR